MHVSDVSTFVSFVCMQRFYSQSLVSTTNEVVKYIIYERIHVLQAMVCTSSVPNYRSFDFFDIKFDHSSYSKNLCKHSQI